MASGSNSAQPERESVITVISIPQHQNDDITSPMTETTPVVPPPPVVVEASTTSSHLENASNDVSEDKSDSQTQGTNEKLTSQSPMRKDLRGMMKMEAKFDDGYDTDGEAGPFYDCHNDEGPQLYDEEELTTIDVDAVMNDDEQGGVDDELVQLADGSDADADGEGDSEDIVEATVVPEHIPIEESVLNGMKVLDLKEQLKLRGQPVGGIKSVLLSRLKKALDEKIPVGGGKESTTTTKEKDESNKKKGLGGIFPDTAFWKPLKAIVNPTTC